MKRHIDEAKSAGIEGFIVSWKSTSINNRRLEALMSVARAADFKLAIIYQGLDFSPGTPASAANRSRFRALRAALRVRSRL